MITSYMGYILIMFTHRGHACVSACVINCSLIYGRFLFKFAVNILQITTSSKCYVLFMFTHRAHACESECESACSSARVVKHSIIFRRILFKFDGHILLMTTSYERVCASVRMRARVCECVCAIKRSLIFERILSKFGWDIQQIPRGYMGYNLS
jgi:hypothetical protein